MHISIQRIRRFFHSHCSHQTKMVRYPKISFLIKWQVDLQEFQRIRRTKSRSPTIPLEYCAAILYYTGTSFGITWKLPLPRTILLAPPCARRANFISCFKPTSGGSLRASTAIVGADNSDASNVGATGNRVGCGVGPRVGRGVGNRLGPGVGSRVGPGVVGTAVGYGVGSGVGSRVGGRVGRLVGLEVGLGVGFLVGPLVGRGEGRGVGFRVGGRVGLRVG